MIKHFLKMINKIKKILNMFSNMGMRYVLFRILFLLKTKLGWQKQKFPTNPEFCLLYTSDAADE